MVTEQDLNRAWLCLRDGKASDRVSARIIMDMKLKTGLGVCVGGNIPKA